MAEIYGASLTPIYNRLNSALQYHPLDAETFADWSLEAGDVVTFTRDGTDYETPVYSTNLKWRKKQEISISSTGQEKRTSVAKMSQRKFSGGKSGLINTQRTYELIETSYNGMRAGLELSSSAAKLYVDNMYTQMSSGLELTASTAKLYVNDAYNQMKSGLALSTSSAKLYVDNKYAQMQSGLMLTASSAYLYVDNKYSQMQSGLTLTASTAKLYVDNKYLQMKSGLELTSSSAMLYAQNRTTRAYIMTRINANDEGEALISADKIHLDGNVTLSGALRVNNGSICTNGNIQAGLLGESYIRGTSLKLIAASSSQGATEYTMTGANLGTTIKNASINENDQLVLEKYNGDTITFSRAASTGKFSGSWSGSTFTVTADPNGKTWLQTKLYGSLVGTGDVSKSGKWVYRNFIVYEDDEGSAGKKLMEVPVGINATDIWNDGWDSAYGCVSWPQEGTGITFSVGAPKSDRTGSESKTFTITKDTTASSTGHAYVSLGGTTVGQIDIGGWYTAGQNAVTLTDGWKSVASLTASRTYEVKTSGRPTQLTKSKTVYLSVDTWSSGSIPIYIRDGSTSGTIVAQNSVSLPAVSSTTWKNTTGKTWRADLSIGGATRSSSTKDFSGYYTDGYNDCYDKIFKITVDENANHNASWWNFICYDSDGNQVKKVITNASSRGLYFTNKKPTITANGNYKASDFGVTLLDGVVVSVPTGGDTYKYYELKCTNAVAQSGLVTYTFQFQSSSDSFKKGTNYAFYRKA